MKNITVCLLALFMLCSFQKSADVKTKLIGTWTFERFDFPPYVEKKLANEQNAVNKGLVIIFTKDGKVISTQGNGKKAEKTYSLTADSKFVVMNKEKSEIQKLDNNILMLSLPGRPVLVLKKKK